jgi:hypothetical protein
LIELLSRAALSPLVITSFNLTDLYTCDVDITNLPLETLPPSRGKKDAKLKRVKARIARDKYRELCFSGEVQASAKFETDKDFVIMRQPFPQVIHFTKLSEIL